MPVLAIHLSSPVFVTCVKRENDLFFARASSEIEIPNAGETFDVLTVSIKQRSRIPWLLESLDQVFL